MTYHDAFYGLRRDLRAVYDDGEASTIAKLYLKEVTGIDYSRGLARRDEILEAEASARIRANWPHLAGGKPLQYVLGYADFLGRRYVVDERVLIPRPETEGLVQWVTEDYVPGPLQILDAGTGSGCIAISLALALREATVLAGDVSVGALAVAGGNAVRLGAKIQCLQFDMLQPADWQGSPLLDIVVSNPPYIPASEKAFLDRNVRDYEPPIALFAPDADPVLFYRTLALGGKAKLRPGGQVYCEFQSGLVEETAHVFMQAGYTVELRRDSYDAWRMLRATAPV